MKQENVNIGMQWADEKLRHWQTLQDKGIEPEFNDRVNASIASILKEYQQENDKLRQLLIRARDLVYKFATTRREVLSQVEYTTFMNQVGTALEVKPE